MGEKQKAIYRLPLHEFDWAGHTDWRPNHVKVHPFSPFGLFSSAQIWLSTSGTAPVHEEPQFHSLGDRVNYGTLSQIGIEALMGMVTIRHTQLAPDSGQPKVQCGHDWCSFHHPERELRMVAEVYPTQLKNFGDVTAVGCFLYPVLGGDSHTELEIADPALKAIFTPLSDGRILANLGAPVSAGEDTEDTSYMGQGLLKQEPESHMIYPRKMPSAWYFHDGRDADRIRFVLVCNQEADANAFLPPRPGRNDMPLHIEWRRNAKPGEELGTRRWTVFTLGDDNLVYGQLWKEYMSVPALYHPFHFNSARLFDLEPATSFLAEPYSRWGSHAQGGK